MTLDKIIYLEEAITLIEKNKVGLIDWYNPPQIIYTEHNTTHIYRLDLSEKPYKYIRYTSFTQNQ